MINGSHHAMLLTDQLPSTPLEIAVEKQKLILANQLATPAYYRTSQKMMKHITPQEDWNETTANLYHATQARLLLLKGNPWKAYQSIKRITNTSLADPLWVWMGDLTKKPSIVIKHLDRMIAQNPQANSYYRLLWKTLSINKTLIRWVRPEYQDAWQTFLRMKSEGLNQGHIIQWYEQYASLFPQLKTYQALPDAPKEIAILLPQSGPYAHAGKAVLSGIQTAFYHIKNQELHLTIYDTASEPMPKVLQAIEQNHTDMVIGPLVKEHIQAYMTENPTIPTLLLNQSTDLNEHVYSMSLSQANEAEQLAQWMHAQGYQSPLVIHLEDWNNDSETRFLETWAHYQKQSIHYNLSQSDKINANLWLTTNQHKSQIASQIDYKVIQDPIRRQDIDAVVLFAPEHKAKSIIAKLRYAGAHDLPFFMTSASLPSNISRDIDWQNIKTLDAPWVADHWQRKFTNASWPEQYDYTHRLNALGLDSLYIALKLDIWANIPWMRYKGATGVYWLDPGQHAFSRLMTPVSLSQGILQPTGKHYITWWI